jgi:hypothetical protein
MVEFITLDDRTFVFPSKTMFLGPHKPNYKDVM